MIVHFSFSNNAISPATVPVMVGGNLTYPPFYGSINYYVFCNGNSTYYPQIVVGQDMVGQQTVFTFYMDMGFTQNVAKSQIDVRVNGSAPLFVFDGSLSATYTGAVIKIPTPQVMYSSVNKPPASAITGLTDYVNNISPQKYLHPNWSNNTMYYKLGFLVLPQNGHQAKITLLACQGYNVSNGIKSQAYTPQNYECNIYIYSSNTFSSVPVDSGSNTSGITDNGCFHQGFVQLAVFSLNLIMYIYVQVLTTL